MADLLKPSQITGAGPMPWMADASVIVVTKIVIEQFWSIRWVAGPWPGWGHGYALFLFLCRASLMLTHGRIPRIASFSQEILFE